MHSDVSSKELTNILVIEDNETDIEAVERACKKANIKCTLQSACDGVEALALLKGLAGKSKIQQPCVILLDINMPRMNGFQFLTELRADDALKQNIVFMLTTSGRPNDRWLAYEHNVAGYFLKQSLETLVETLAAYCEGNEFPSAILN